MGAVGVDKETGRVIFQKPVAAQKQGAEKVELEYVSIPTAAMDILRGCASADGFKPNAETEKGQATQAKRAATQYILLGIELLLERRAQS